MSMKGAALVLGLSLCGSAPAAAQGAGTIVPPPPPAGSFTPPLPTAPPAPVYAPTPPVYAPAPPVYNSYGTGYSTGYPGVAQEQLASARTLRNVGITLTVIGGALALSGTIALIAWADNGSEGARVYGAIGMLTGLPLLGAGIPLTVVGQRRVTAARQAGAYGLSTPRLSPMLAFDPARRSGLSGLALSF